MFLWLKEWTEVKGVVFWLRNMYHGSANNHRQQITFPRQWTENSWLLWINLKMILKPVTSWLKLMIFAYKSFVTSLTIVGVGEICHILWGRKNFKTLWKTYAYIHICTCIHTHKHTPSYAQTHCHHHSVCNHSKNWIYYKQKLFSFIFKCVQIRMFNTFV
jgi:hypothetical protein